MLSFKPAFSFPSFTFIKRLFFISSSLYAIRVVLSAYLRLLIFLPAILILAYASSSSSLHMMYSAYKLNNQDDNLQPWLLLSQFGTRPLFHIQFCFFLTCIQISQDAGKVVWYSHLFQDFPRFVVNHTVKGFSVVSGVEADVFLEFSFSGSSAFSKSSLNILKYSVHILLKPCLENF